jgi:hypothetical protein
MGTMSLLFNLNTRPGKQQKWLINEFLKNCEIAASALHWSNTQLAYRRRNTTS